MKKADANIRINAILVAFYSHPFIVCTYIFFMSQLGLVLDSTRSITETLGLGSNPVCNNMLSTQRKKTCVFVCALDLPRFHRSFTFVADQILKPNYITCT